MMTLKSFLALSMILSTGVLALIFAVGSMRNAGGLAATEWSSTDGEVDGGAPGAPDDEDLPFREEVRRKFKLAEGSTVEIGGLNGSVTTETIGGDEAEVLVVRSARSEADLERDQLRFEQRGDRLEIGLVKQRLFGQSIRTGRGRQRAILRLPSRINLEVNGLNGRLTIDEIDGRLKVSGVNGRTQARRVAGAVEVSGNNGAVDLTCGPKFGAPIEISGVNGAITLRFEGEVNSTLEAHGNNGKIDSDLPGYVVREGSRGHGQVEARIGNGGAPIRINGVNGSIRLLRAGGSESR